MGEDYDPVGAWWQAQYAGKLMLPDCDIGRGKERLHGYRPLGHAIDTRELNRMLRSARSRKLIWVKIGCQGSFDLNQRLLILLAQVGAELKRKETELRRRASGVSKAWTKVVTVSSLCLSATTAAASSGPR